MNMRHGFTTMNEIRNGMENMLDTQTMMHLTNYKVWPYTVEVAQELIDKIDIVFSRYSPMCKETILWAFHYATHVWEYANPAALDLLIDAWLNTGDD